MTAPADVIAALREMFLEDYGREATKEELIEYARECGLPG